MAQNNIGWENMDIDDSCMKKWLIKIELWRNSRIMLNLYFLGFHIYVYMNFTYKILSRSVSINLK